MASLCNIYLLCLNALIWIITYFYAKQKYGVLSIGTILILIYTLISVISIYVFLNPMARNDFIDNLSIIPFIYLYVMLIISIRPTFNFSPKYISAIEIPKPKLLNFICLFFCVFSISSLFKVFPNLQTGLVDLLIDPSYAADQYAISTYERMNQVRSSDINIIAIIGNISNKITPFLFFCYLLQKNKNKIIFTMLCLCLIITPLEGIANASRMSIVTSFFLYGLLYIFFFPYLNKLIRQKLKKVFFIIFVVFGLFFLIISIGRNNTASGNTNLIYGFARYFSEGPLIFNNYCLDAGGTRSGEYTFAIQHIHERSKQPNESELRDRFRNLKIDSSRFYTYVGDFTLDFGPLGAFLIFIIFFFMVYNPSIIKKRTMTFPQMILLFILIKFCGGFYQYQFSMSTGNATLLMLILLYVTSRMIKACFPYSFDKVYISRDYQSKIRNK